MCCHLKFVGYLGKFGGKINGVVNAFKLVAVPPHHRPRRNDFAHLVVLASFQHFLQNGVKFVNTKVRRIKIVPFESVNAGKNFHRLRINAVKPGHAVQRVEQFKRFGGMSIGIGGIFQTFFEKAVQRVILFQCHVVDNPRGRRQMCQSLFVAFGQLFIAVKFRSDHFNRHHLVFDDVLKLIFA